MATITKPMALDETLQATNTKLQGIIDAIADSSVIGDTDISGIADGTLTGAVAEFDTSITNLESDKVDKVTGKELSTNDFTDALKSKLDGIESGAQVNPTIDSALSESSENAVQNKVINTALDGKADDSDVASSTTVTGNPITITDAQNMHPEGMVLEFEPIQDLHGYDKPWVGGAGKNKVDIDDIIIEGGTSYPLLGDQLTLTAGTYTLSFTMSDDITANRSRPYYEVIYSGGSYSVYGDTDFTTAGRHSLNITLNTNMTIQFRWWNVAPSQSYTVSDFMLEEGSTATSYEPYSNICPITGYTRGEVTTADSDTDPTTTDSTTIQFGQTVYGGTLNVITGELSVTMANIASYNGETINEPWLSSMDEYVSGTTPTTGAQVVYTLTTPTTIQLSPSTLLTLADGYNLLTTNANELELTYQSNNVIGELKKKIEDIPTVNNLVPVVWGNHQCVPLSGGGGIGVSTGNEYIVLLLNVRLTETGNIVESRMCYGHEFVTDFDFELASSGTLIRTTVTRTISDSTGTLISFNTFMDSAEHYIEVVALFKG